MFQAENDSEKRKELQVVEKSCSYFGADLRTILIHRVDLSPTLEVEVLGKVEIPMVDDFLPGFFVFRVLSELLASLALRRFEKSFVGF